MFCCKIVWLYITLVVYWLLWAGWMPASAFVGDTCNFIDDAQPDLSAHIGGDAARVIDACLLDTSVIEATNAANALTFASNITFPDYSSLVNGTEPPSPAILLTAYDIRVQALNLMTGFGFNSTIADVQLFDLNEMSSPPTNFTRETVSTCDPSTYPPADQSRAETLRDDILWRIDAQSRLELELVRWIIPAGVTAHTSNSLWFCVVLCSGRSNRT